MLESADNVFFLRGNLFLDADAPSCGGPWPAFSAKLNIMMLIGASKEMKVRITFMLNVMMIMVIKSNHIFGRQIKCHKCGDNKTLGAPQVCAFSRSSISLPHRSWKGGSYVFFLSFKCSL